MEASTETPTAQELRRTWSPGWVAAGVVALLVLVLLVYGLIGTPAPPQIGDPAPAFQVPAFDGTTMSLGVPDGAVVVLNVFASWCEPCREEAADLQQAWLDYGGRGVQFYGLAYKDAGSKAQAFLEEFEVTYPAGVDPGNRTARAYGVTGVPETFVIDGAGRLAHHFVGPITAAQLRQQLDPLLAP